MEPHETNRVKQIHTDFKQSIWLDFIDREIMRSGKLQKLIDEDDIRGVTSNPAIFEQAISASADYDADILELSKTNTDPEYIFFQLAINDIQKAADLFLPIYNEEVNGADGYVSLEVSPLLALNETGTIKQTRELWQQVSRKNVMIKIPGTLPCLPAIRATISEGININVTLLFGLERYEAVANAYIEGLEDRLASGQDISKIASVASFFLSRIDLLVDPLLSDKGHNELKGEAAIAAAKAAYALYRRIFSGDRWQKLADAGAKPQRLLWASTGNKNPAYRDTRYIEELIGPNTVNTAPLATIEAFRDHGNASARLEAGPERAIYLLEALATAGINMTAIALQLEIEGIHKFEAPYQKLLVAITDKINTNKTDKQKPMEISENTMDVINDLIEINNDRVEGFEKAARDLEDHDSGLNMIFKKLANESRENATVLTEIAQNNGQAPVDGTSTSGVLHRAWLDVKSVFTGGDAKSILDECERGEDAIKDAYSTALSTEHEIGYELQAILQKQQMGIVAGHDLIKSLRNQYDDDEDSNEANAAEPVSLIGGPSVDPAGQGFSAQPNFEVAADEYNENPTYQPEPESNSQESEWQNEQMASSGDSKLMEFFINELQDLLWAERELVETLPAMAEAATSPELKAAFEMHLTETESHVKRLEQIFGVLGLEPESRKCEAMAGILDEGEEIIDATEEGTAQRDVGLIFAGQKAEHYEIASYGGMIALAKTLGYYEIAETLVLTLNEEKTADSKLTEIAESQANYAASTESAED
ncbi:transaldolase [Mucilaginibacter jinjuensis]|uniref:Transaldolase n=1 Tax=Mucilaginibacter jinjuensis TaxID=1176721 RepID=A0ABY7T2V0_9SPHI|nr:transaldolase [Mucilaginibacter jinjuensis]WCT10711.1 transaldolase [Mucilaginibacter jinjuensis]